MTIDRTWRLRNRFVAPATLLALGSVIWLNAPIHATPPGRAPGASEAAEAEVSTPPQLWVHGATMGDSTAVTKLGAQGMRFIVNMRSINVDTIRDYVRRAEAHDLGLCLTLRWVDEDGDGRYDAPPTREEARRQTAELIEALQSAGAGRLDGEFWIQFFNEIGDGPGTVRPSDMDAMLEYATAAVRTIREALPSVNFCGPAMTDVASLKRRGRELRDADRDQYQATLKGLRWSVQHADAVDVHVRASGGEHAERLLDSFRLALDTRAEAQDVRLVCWEWSPAGLDSGADEEAVRRVINEIWAAMSEAGVEVAAYSPFDADTLSGEAKWARLVDENGQPREPFFTAVAALAADSRDSGPARVDEPKPRPGDDHDEDDH